jgi:TM2 domain-containing membrane protein YozV
MVPSKPGAKYAHGKNLPAAILLSCLLLPGLGHLYCGDIVKGILFVIAAILAVIYTGPGVFVVSIFALIDVCGVATGKKPLWLM